MSLLHALFPVDMCVLLHDYGSMSKKVAFKPLEL